MFILSASEFTRWYKTVILHTDTCCGSQSKHSHVASMFTYLLQVKPTLTEIHHKFLVPGHTHLKCDADHSIIERQKKKSESFDVATTIIEISEWVVFILWSLIQICRPIFNCSFLKWLNLWLLFINNNVAYSFNKAVAKRS